jgi:hypothetical protein
VLILTLISDWCISNERYHSMLPIVKEIFESILPQGIIDDICNEYISVIDNIGQMHQTIPAEDCLACHEAISLKSPWKAICVNGHRWERCSATLLTAATPKTNSCRECNKKYLTIEALSLPPDSLLDEDNVGKSDIMQSILKGLTHCIYCGNGLAKTFY